MIRIRYPKFRINGLWMILLALVLFGCQFPPLRIPTLPPKTPELATQNPSIRGIITVIFTPNGKFTGFLVEGKIESDTSYDKASVRVNEKTLIYNKTADGFKLTDIAALKIGVRVEVLFKGPVQESYPVGATAGEIVILQ